MLSTILEPAAKAVVVMELIHGAAAYACLQNSGGFLSREADITSGEVLADIAAGIRRRS
ncbi:MAG: hypothetical protein U1F16_06585 [Turneriella sp.]